MKYIRYVHVQYDIIDYLKRNTKLPKWNEKVDKGTDMEQFGALPVLRFTIISKTKSITSYSCLYNLFSYHGYHCKLSLSCLPSSSSPAGLEQASDCLIEASLAIISLILSALYLHLITGVKELAAKCVFGFYMLVVIVGHVINGVLLNIHQYLITVMAWWLSMIDRCVALRGDLYIC